MGRWSRHPMGSDGALDAQDELFSDIYEYCEENDIDFWGEQGHELRVKFLTDITLDELYDLVSDGCLSDNSFVIPYLFLECKINRPELKDFLIECFDYREDIEGEWNYCSETDENGEILELKHIRFFKEHFDEIMNGEIELPDDPGLFAAMETGSGLINKM